MTTAKSEMTEDQFVGLVRGAAIQMAIMRAWNDDQRLEDDGWKTFYAADADIFALYGNPAMVACTIDGRLGYGQVFDSDPPDKATALAERLADHICFELSGENPLLVIPPIDQEIRSQINALSTRLGREPAAFRIDLAEMQSGIATLEGAVGSPPPHDVLTLFAKLIGLRGQSPQVEYRRLHRLFEEQRLIPTHSRSATDALPAQFSELFEQRRDLGEIYDHIQRTEQWLKRLVTGPVGKISKQKFLKFRHDAEALSLLEIWNQKLAMHKIRIVYITGAIHIIQAGRKYDLDGEDFAKRYIRHPRYFMASRDVIAANDADDSSDRPAYAASEFFGWIRTFLGRMAISDRELQREDHFFALSSKIENAAKNAFNSSPDIGLELLEKWQAYLSNLQSSYVPPKQIFDDIVKDLRSIAPNEANAVLEWDRVRSSLGNAIEAERDQAWDACFSTVVKAGFFVNTGVFGSEAVPSRRVPPVKFESWKKTESFVAKMAEWRLPDDIDHNDYQAGIVAMRKETKANFDYAYFLSHAALFAARKDWQVGAILALRATEKAESPEPGDGTRGHGRESNFLTGYCLRHSARTAEDCKSAISYFEKAQRIFDQEKIIRPNLDIVPERFSSEIFACEVSIALFSYFGKNSTPKMGKVEIIKLRDAIFVELSSLSQILNDDGSLTDVKIRESCNILMLSALLRIFDEKWTFAGDLLADLISNYDETQTLYVSTLMYVYRSVSGNAAKKNVLNAHFTKVTRSHKIFPYDTQRFELLHDLALSG